MKIFLLIVLITVFGFSETITLTNRQLQEKLASGEATVAWDENITKVETTNALAKLEAKIWLLEDNTKKKIDAINNNMKILWARLQQLESYGCECEVRCRSKKARDMIEDIEGLIDDVESRVSDLETKVEEIK